MFARLQKCQLLVIGEKTDKSGGEFYVTQSSGSLRAPSMVLAERTFEL